MYNTNNILSGKVVLAGDKSISHRLLMVGSLLKGECVIDNISLCDDVQSTIDCLRGCNVDIKINNNAAYIAGSSLSNPKKDLNCKNSGTAARLLLGLFAGQNISAKLIGDKSLSNRPMSRIIKPLIDAGAMIKSNNNNLPITIISGIKKPVVYKNKTKSAQVKSSLILSGLGLDNATYISYNQSTRDHLEKILKYLNFDINVGPSVCIRKSLKNKIKFNLYVPGDISNASFLIVAALIIPNSKIKIENVLYNKTRVGFINLLLKMGANIKISNIREKSFEKICNINVQYTPHIKGATVEGDEIVEIIDEVPILSILATQVNGVVVIKDAEELRIKESDRLHAICSNLAKFGADIIENEDGFILKGGKKLYSATINHFNDHRIAMSLEILQLLLTKKMTYNFKNCIAVSFPEFYNVMDELLS